MKQGKILRRIRECLAVTLAGLLVAGTLGSELRAQESPAPKLRIVILDGDGAINNIRQRTAREPVIQVEDQNRKPVAGAMVLFTLPDRGAGAVFADGSRTQIAYTDAQGKATAKGMRPNTTTGQFQIVVNASYQGLATSATISQVNMVAAAAGAAAGGAAGAAAGISKTLIAILAIAAGAAATGAVVATRGGPSATIPAPIPQPQPVPSITINAPGNPNFGPPQ